MAEVQQTKISRLKDQLRELNLESSKIKKELNTEQKRVFLENLNNSRHNIRNILDVKLSLRSVLVFCVCILFIIGLVYFVQYLGTFSVATTTKSNDLSDITKSVNETSTLKEILISESNNKSQENIPSTEDSGPDAGLPSSNSNTSSTETSTEISNSDVNDTTANSTATEVTKEVPLEDQDLIDDYQNVEIEFRGDGISTEPKGTYSKVIKIYYSITNNEQGKIQVSEILYEYGSDPAVSVAMLESPTVIGMGKKFDSVVDPADIPKKTHLGTFTAEETEIEYSLTIKDSDGVSIATVKNEFSVN